MKTRYVRTIVLLLSIFFYSLAGMAQTSWTGTASNRWDLAGNWTNGVPTMTMDAIVGDAYFTGNFLPTFNSTTGNTCLNLTVGGSKAATLTVNKTLTVYGNLLINPNGTIIHNGTSATDLNIKGNWTNNGTYTAVAGTGIVRFSVNEVSINGSNFSNFQRLAVAGGSVLTANVNISVAVILTVTGTFIPAENITPVVISGAGGITVGSAGVLKINAATFAGNYALTGAVSLDDNNTIEYSATLVNQTIKETFTYSTLAISGAMVKTLGGNLPTLVSTVNSNGKIKVVSGTLDLSTFTANRGLPQGGTLTVSNGATLRIGGTNTLPANFRIHTFGPSSTVEYSGTNQLVTDTTAIGTATTYGNLILSSSSGAAVKTMPATALIVAGNLISTVNTGTSVSFTAGAAITVSGNLSVGAATTFNASSYTHTVQGNWVNHGNFIAATSNISFNGSTDATISGASLFNILTINKDASTNLITLLNNDTASTMDVVTGAVHTDSNTITITNTRTGDGIILGNIRQTHSFTTGVAYSFEGPDNTITFCSVSGVTTITVKVTVGVVTDFPGTAVNRQYNIVIPSGTYSSTLRLHYEDAELNGNDESVLQTWHFVGTAWSAAGKSGNDESSNYVEQTGLTDITNRWTLSDNTGGMERISLLNTLAPIQSVNDIRVYPNPVSNGRVTLFLNNMAKAQYPVKLMDSNGQIVYMQNIYHNGGTSSQVITLNKSVTPGIYYLIISGKDKTYTQKLFIEK